jgi:N-terminal acetyltransferase B complex non-catalytic subunit
LQVTALSVLKNISAVLMKRADLEGSVERRNAITSCLDIKTPQVCISIQIAYYKPIREYFQDFIINHAKKITDSQRKVLKGVAKGIARICTAYT